MALLTTFPKHYALTLTPSLSTTTFTGTVSITLLITTPTICLNLHAHKLAIHNTALYSFPCSLKGKGNSHGAESGSERGSGSGRQSQRGKTSPTHSNISPVYNNMKIKTNIPIVETSFGKESQTFNVLLEDYIPPSTTLLLCIDFSGVLGTDGVNEGWFIPPGQQAESHGVAFNYNYNDYKAKFTTTHFEPSFARTVFPCLDTPTFKTPFSIELIIPRTLTALSNMPIKSTKDLPLIKGPDGFLQERLKSVKFEDTPPLPTYLVAFAVGDFQALDLDPRDPVTEETKDDVDIEKRILIRAYVPRGYGYRVDRCRYGLQTARRSIAILSEMLQSPFPLQKLDLLLVPSMSSGMENWGLITLSVNAFLIAPDNSVADRVVVTQTIAHEIAHSWFGNLVTPRGWEDFWWKEGLCEWADIEIRERMVGNFEAAKDWVADGLQVASFVSAWKFRHTSEVNSGGDGGVMKSLYYQTTNKKECAVMRMLASYLGMEVFIQGLRLFVRLHSFGNACGDDLWNAISQASGIDVGAFMRPWVRGVGMPLVEVREDGMNKRVCIEQSIFRMLTPDPGDKDDQLLPIPLGIVTSTGVYKDLFDSKSKTANIPSNFYTINTGQTGFFHVAYSADRLSLICDEMCKGHLSVEDRIGLICNSTALAFSGHPTTRISNVLLLLQNFEDEESFFVWKAIMATLDQIKRYLMFEDAKLIVAFEKFWKHLVKRCLYRKGQFSVDDDITEQRFKALMFGNSGGDEKVLVAAELMFDRFVKNEGKEINPNLRAEVFKVVLSNRGKKEYNDLESRLKSASVAERNDILCTLGYSLDSHCIRKTIKRAISTDSIMCNEMIKIAQSLTTHAAGVNALWKFIASEIWTQNPLLTTKKMASLSSLLFMSYTKREQAEVSRRFFGEDERC